MAQTLAIYSVSLNFMPVNTVAIASDHAGFELKESLKAFLGERGIATEDLGAHSAASVDYPDYGHAIAGWIAAHPDGMGIAICGSGIGISIAANRHKHVRAALCHNGLTAGLARQHNNANVLCLGARIIDTTTAKDCVSQFLNTKFEGGRHAVRLEKL